MAENLDEGKTGKRGRKKKDEAPGPGMGHNVTRIKELAEPIFERLDRLHDDMESMAGEIKSDIKNVYEEGANNIGCKRGILRKVYKLYRDGKKIEEALAEMESHEREEYETLADAVGVSTPMGAWAASKAHLDEAIETE